MSSNTSRGRLEIYIENQWMGSLIWNKGLLAHRPCLQQYTGLFVNIHTQCRRPALSSTSTRRIWGSAVRISHKSGGSMLYMTTQLNNLDLDKLYIYIYSVR